MSSVVQLFGGDEYDFSLDARRTVSRLCVDMENAWQHYTTEASFDDFIESLCARVQGGYRPVAIKVGEIDAELTICMINSDLPEGSGHLVDFSAWMFFRTGKGVHVRGRFVHMYTDDDLPRGSVCIGPLPDEYRGPRSR